VPIAEGDIEVAAAYFETYLPLMPQSVDATGWEFVHVAIDDYSRLVYVEVLGDEKAVTAVVFLRRATAFCPTRDRRQAADH
jgi:hypothetical protein